MRENMNAVHSLVHLVPGPLLMLLSWVSISFTNYNLAISLIVHIDFSDIFLDKVVEMPTFLFHPFRRSILFQV